MKTMAPVTRISPQDLRERLHVDDEIAVLDVREEGAFVLGHLLLASSLPISRIELGLRDLVPRRTTPIVLCDQREEVVDPAAARLQQFGYTDLAILEGGTDAWAKAGFELFTGLNVPSKAFGELVEATYATPSLPPEELKALLDSGTDVRILDSRPLDEHRMMTIPGSIDCPGAELVHRISDLAPSPETTVVVHCAGRTRSIIGAQSLRDAGIPNKVLALRNGTMGWHLAGFDLARGSETRPPDASPAGLARARAMADEVGARAGVRTIDPATLERWRAERDQRTLYVFDVRSPEEYAAGHLPGTRPAPGGQLVQRTDAFMATRGARVVLVDDAGVRATMTAAWLTRMGVDDVFVLEGGFDDANLEAGPYRPEVLGLDDAAVKTITPAALAGLPDRDEGVVIDLATSLTYRAGHIPGAWFAIRSRLNDALTRLPEAGTFVLTSDDGILARLAAPELARESSAEVLVLDGGTSAWRAAGHPLAEGLERLANDCDDVFWRPYDRDEGAEAAMNEYLAWEHGLIEQVERDGTARFRLP